MRPEGLRGSLRGRRERAVGHCVPKVRAHLAIQQVCVLLAEHFLVILEDAAGRQVLYHLSQEGSPKCHTIA